MSKKTKEALDIVLQYTKETHGLDLTKVHKTRKGMYVRFRASIFVSMMKFFGMTSVELGELFQLDHTSILHHKKNHCGRYQSDDEYAETYDEIAKYVIALRSKMVGEDPAELPKVISLIRGLAS